MKKLWVAVALFSTTLLSYGQGTVQFQNDATSRVQYGGGVENIFNDLPVGTAVVYGLFYGATSTSLSLAPVLGAPSTTVAGIITAPNALAYAIPGFAEGATPFLQMRGWSSSFGSDWQAARNAYVPGVVFYAETAIIQSAPLGTAAIGPGTPIWQSAGGTNPNRFTPLIFFTVIPEPSTIGLGIIGGVILCLSLRRQRILR